MCKQGATFTVTMQLKQILMKKNQKQILIKKSYTLPILYKDK